MRYRFGNYVRDAERQELHCAGVPITLRRIVFQVLVYLLAHRDRVVPKLELLEQLWPDHFVGEATLTSCIKTLRQALGGRGRTPRFLRMLHGQGYRFVAAVEEREHDPTDEAPYTFPSRGGEGTTLHAKGLSPALPSPLTGLELPLRGTGRRAQTGHRALLCPGRGANAGNTSRA